MKSSRCSQPISLLKSHNDLGFGIATHFCISVKLSNLPFQMAILLYEILVTKKLLVKLCVGNYQTSNVFVNGVDGILNCLIKTISKFLTCVNFHNLRIGHNTKIKIYKSKKNFSSLKKHGCHLNVKLSKYK
jgi:hypothetical protein